MKKPRNYLWVVEAFNSVRGYQCGNAYESRELARGHVKDLRAFYKNYHEGETIYRVSKFVRAK